MSFATLHIFVYNIFIYIMCYTFHAVHIFGVFMSFKATELAQRLEEDRRRFARRYLGGGRAIAQPLRGNIITNVWNAFHNAFEQTFDLRYTIEIYNIYK